MPLTQTVSLTALTALAAGCTPLAARPPATTLAPVVVDYEVINPASRAPVVAGTTGLWAGGDSAFKQSLPNSPNGVEIMMQAKQVAGDRILIRVKYREISAAGGGPLQNIDWEPSLLVAPKSKATVLVDGPAGGRELTLSVR